MTLTALKAISEGHGDTALSLLKAGAETDKRDVDGQLAIDLAPDMKVCNRCTGSSSQDKSLISYRRYENSLYRKQNVRESTSYDRVQTRFLQPPKERPIACAPCNGPGMIKP